MGLTARLGRVWDRIWGLPAPALYQRCWWWRRWRPATGHTIPRWQEKAEGSTVRTGYGHVCARSSAGRSWAAASQRPSQKPQFPLPTYTSMQLPRLLYMMAGQGAALSYAWPQLCSSRPEAACGTSCPFEGQSQSWCPSQISLPWKLRSWRTGSPSLLLALPNLGIQKHIAHLFYWPRHGTMTSHSVLNMQAEPLSQVSYKHMYTSPIYSVFLQIKT